MKIYELTPVEGFRDISVDDRRCKSDKEFNRLQTALYFTGVPIVGKWNEPPLYSAYPKKPFADVRLLGSGVIAVTAKKLDVLEMFLEMAGQLFPVHFADNDFVFCNITECVDCIDESKSVWKELSGGNRIYRKTHFDFSTLPESTLFKIPQWPTRIYCWERHNDPEGEFKACCEKHKLKGIHFRLIQSGEE